MIFGQDRQQLRQMYIDAWRKAQAGQPLSPLDAQIAAVVEQHPEYHDVLKEDSPDETYTPQGGQTNPFLHMGLHLAIREQVATDRPAGIAAIHRSLCERSGDLHQAEHRMIDCLAESLWEAQKRNQPPDENVYLERLQRLTI